MDVQRLHTTDDGGSTFTTVSIDLSPTTIVHNVPPVHASELIDVEFLQVIEVADPIPLERHNAPVAQMSVILNGGWRLTASDGEERQFGPGDIVFQEDLDGLGHHTVIEEFPLRLLRIGLRK